MDDCYFENAHYSYRGQIFHIFIVKNNDKKFIEESYNKLFDLVELFGFKFIVEDCHIPGGLGVGRNEIIVCLFESKYFIFEEKILH